MKKSTLLYASLFASAALIPAVVVQAEQPKTIPDGTYEVPFLTYKTGTTETSGMANRFEKIAKLVVKDGEAFIQLHIINQNQLLDAMHIPYKGKTVTMTTLEGSTETTERIIQLPIEKFNEAITVTVDVLFPGSATPVVQTFDLIVDAPEAGALTEKVKLTAYKLNSTEASAMQRFIDPTVELHYDVNKTVAHITFTAKQYIKAFSLNGIEAKVIAEQDEHVTYAVEVANPAALQVAKMSLDYGNGGSVQEAHLHFAVKGAPVMVQNPFTDIEALANKAVILNLYNKGIIKESSHFNPSNTITREHFALMIARTLKLTSTEAGPFKDTASLAAESKSAIAALAKEGIIKPVELFNPTEPIKREHAALMIYRAMQYHVGTDALDFGNSIGVYADANLVTSEESQRALSFLHVSNSYTGLKQDGASFAQPQATFTRAEIASLLNNTLKYLGH